MRDTPPSVAAVAYCQRFWLPPLRLLPCPCHRITAGSIDLGYLQTIGTDLHWPLLYQSNTPPLPGEIDSVFQRPVAAIHPPIPADIPTKNGTAGSPRCDIPPAEADLRKESAADLGCAAAPAAADCVFCNPPADHPYGYGFGAAVLYPWKESAGPLYILCVLGKSRRRDRLPLSSVPVHPQLDLPTAVIAAPIVPWPQRPFPTALEQNPFHRGDRPVAVSPVTTSPNCHRSAMTAKVKDPLHRTAPS